MSSMKLRCMRLTPGVLPLDVIVTITVDNVNEAPSVIWARRISQPTTPIVTGLPDALNDHPEDADEGLRTGDDPDGSWIATAD